MNKIGQPPKPVGNIDWLSTIFEELPTSILDEFKVFLSKKCKHIIILASKFKIFKYYILFTFLLLISNCLWN